MVDTDKPDSKPPEDDVSSPVTESIVNHLREQEQNLPQSVQQKLQAARRQSLDSSKQGRKFPFVFTWQPVAMGMAFSALLAVTLVWQATDSSNPSAVINDWELVMDNQDFELLENELAFYQWLEQTEDQG